MSEDTRPQPWLRTRQAAELIGCSPRTLERYRVVGGGPPYHRAGPRLVVYAREDLEAWLRRETFESTSQYADPS